MREVYAAFHSVPDFSGPPPSLVSLHETFDGAFKALYPKPEQARYKEALEKSFRPEHKTYYGPEGYGLIRIMSIKD